MVFFKIAGTVLVAFVVGIESDKASIAQNPHHLSRPSAGTF